MRFSKVDELNRGHHWHIDEQDECYFWGEFTAYKGFAHSGTNNLISNLKKKPSRRGQPEWQYKLQAITTCARFMHASIKPEWLQQPGNIIVPIPPSKSTDDLEYDDRLLKILSEARDLGGWPADIRELVRQRESMAAAHESQDRPSIEDLVANYEIDEELVDPAPRNILIFDDMLTAGTHYKAMQRVLTERFPSVTTVGIFLARRVPESPFDAIEMDPE